MPGKNGSPGRRGPRGKQGKGSHVNVTEIENLLEILKTYSPEDITLFGKYKSFRKIFEIANHFLSRSFIVVVSEFTFFLMYIRQLRLDLQRNPLLSLSLRRVVIYHSVFLHPGIRHPRSRGLCRVKAEKAQLDSGY